MVDVLVTACAPGCRTGAGQRSRCLWKSADSGGGSSLTPKQGIPRCRFTISGSGFGDAQGLGTVRFGSAYAEIESWSDTSINAYVPNGLSLGTFKVSVNDASGADAGGSSFDVDVVDLGTALPRTGWTPTASNASAGDAPGNMLTGPRFLP
ncbi:IPT/TIG domain-containing protein [Streptomyces sp. NPDC001093]|uniref:IPT/TIG domain-containing protein n=1 Tax=Streptomyces sp. NPDC001093 TaxID=3154376 RepID=UPI0033272E26